MRSFKINDKIEVVCEHKKTRTAFKHEATLLINGIEVDSTKICYLNRTWESYEFQSVLSKLIDKTKSLTDDEKELCRIFIKQDHTDWSAFKMVGAIARVGDLICTNQKEKNDWKARMIKAGLGNKGLELPEDWETLNEDEKEKRLNLVIAEVSKVGDKK